MSDQSRVRKAMISSTPCDLPQHCKQVEETCHLIEIFAEKKMTNLFFSTKYTLVKF